MPVRSPNLGVMTPPAATTEPLAPLVASPTPAVRATTVRLTLEPGEDVEVRTGIRVHDLRPALAAALGRDELLHAPLRAGDVMLDPDALTGHAPLLDGARVLVGTVSEPVRPLDLAARTCSDDVVWHIVTGPLTGRVVAAGSLGALPGTPALRTATTPRGLRVRRRLTWRGPCPPVRLRTTRGRLRRWSGRPVVLRPGAGLVWHGQDGTHEAVVVSRQPPPRSTRPAGGAWALLAAPAVTGLTLALMTGRPAYALLALAGPLSMGVQALVRSRSAPSDAPAAPAQAHDERQPWRTLREHPARLLDLLVRSVRLDEHSADATSAGRQAQTPARATAATGPDAERRARAHVCAWAAAHPHGRVVIVSEPTAAASWAWCRWLPEASLCPTADLERVGTPREDLRSGPLLVVLRAAELGGGTLSRWWADAHESTSLLLLADEDTVPAWCTDRVTGPGADSTWADDVARCLARDVRPHAALPRVVPLAPLLGLRSSATAADLALAVGSRWRAAPEGLRTPLGLSASSSGATTPIEVDLTRDGPHGLVAGTTGAGKSELLQTLLCGLALTHPPSELAIALVDYKGGASFGACADLPHVIGLVTDLERGLAVRALTGLQAELRRRERLFAASGATSLDEHRALAAPDDAPVPRLLVVVDEFRSMTQDLPDFVPSLLRLAAQGRSLGMHLVLATQRPGGSVNADMRANLGLRVALRMTDASESRDVVDSPDAAELPAHAPGRAVIVTSRTTHRTVQVAHAPSVASDGAPDARRIAAWGTGITAALGPTTPGEDMLVRLVAAARDAARAAPHPPPRPAWLPALPTRITAHEVPDASLLVAADVGRLPLALLDLPDEQRRELAHWTPATDGHLVVEGGPGSGRTTTLHLLAGEALARGWDVHVLGRPGASHDADPGVGTVVDATDPRRLADLLERLTRTASARRTLALVDNTESVLTALAQVDRGMGADLLTALARSGSAHLVLASSRALPSTLQSQVSARLVLGDRQKAADVSRGVPSNLAGLGGTPGRGVWFGATTPRLAQVLLPARHVASARRSGPSPVRLVAVPQRVHPDDLGRALDSWRRTHSPADAPGPWHLPVGLGGDDGGLRFLDVARGALVVGPAGSGRSTVAAHVAEHLVARLGSGRVVTLAIDGPLTASRADHCLVEASAAALGRLISQIEEAVADGATDDLVVVVDDLPALAQVAPVEVERLLGAQYVGPAVLTASTNAALGAGRGPLAAARARRTGIVLDPGRPGSGDIFGTPLGRATEPGTAAPGRGALVHARLAEPVQLVGP